MDRRHFSLRLGVAWLELLLALAVLALILQLSPSLLANSDFRQWSHGTWCWVNFGVVLALLGIRFLPNLANDWKERHREHHLQMDKTTKMLEKKKQREMLDQIREGRKRRIF